MDSAHAKDRDTFGGRRLLPRHQPRQRPGGGLTTYTWDFENRMTLVQLSTGARVTMAYNANNRRVRKEALEIGRESGATTAVYTQEPGSFGGLISERRGNQSRYYHYLCPCQLAGVGFFAGAVLDPGTEERVGGPGGGDSSPWSPAWTRRNKTARRDAGRDAWQDALAKGLGLAA